MKAVILSALLLTSGLAFGEAPCPAKCQGPSSTPDKITLSKIDSTPACLTRKNDESNEEIVQREKLTDFEVLARLVFAEGISTNLDKCSKYEDSLFASLAWGVQNRVALADAQPRYAKQFGKGLHGVIFKKAQFNPAVSKKSSYSKLFLCPSEHPQWQKFWELSKKAADQALSHPQKNPLPKSVTHFYYPQSTQATNPPVAWADLNKDAAKKAYMKDVKIEGTRYSNECIQFFSY